MDIEKEITGPISEIDRALDPFAMDRRLREVPIDDILSVFAEANSLGKRAWMGMAIACGVAQERSGRGDGVLTQLARSLGYDRSRVVRLARAYRDVISPRLKAQGPAAEFPLAEKGWYETAAESASRLGIDPLALLEDAEAKAIDNPNFTQRVWKSQLGITQSKGSIGVALKNISELETSQLLEFCAEEGNLALLGKVEDLICVVQHSIRESKPAESGAGD